jgi:hypothetical protein
MLGRDYRDVIGGGVLVLAGALVMLYSTTQLEVGSLARMGPGLFPAALGGILSVLGAIIAVPAFFREGAPVTIELRPFLFVLASILVFGLTVHLLGIAPAVVLMVLVSTLAERRMSWPGALLLAAILAALAFLIFNVALDIPVEAVRWPLW